MSKERIIRQQIESEFDSSQSRKYVKWKAGTHTNDKVAFDDYVNNKLLTDYTYNKQEIDSKVNQGGGGSTPSGAPSNIKLDISPNKESSPIKGEFGCNLINYRTLSQDPRIGVNGKILKTIGKQTIDSVHSNHFAGGVQGMSGIKKDRYATINWTWKTKKIELQGAELKCNITYNHNETAQDYKISIDDQTGSQGKKFTDGYGYYRLGLGSTAKVSPQDLKIELSAFYGDIEPKSKLNREFIFKSYNGYKLLSNHRQNVTGQETGDWALHDEYRTGTIFDTLTKKLGHVKLKDCKVHKGVELPDVHQTMKENFVVVEVPSDCETPSGPDVGGTEGKKIGAKCLTNNLCEFTDQLDEQILADMGKPFFYSSVFEHPCPIRDHDGKIIGTKNKYVWAIIIHPQDARKWHELLEETEIIYPLKSEFTTKKQVPHGGYIVTLTNGDYIQSCHYNQIEHDANEGTYTFKMSPFGYANIKIQQSQIVSVTPPKN